jgi:hypothetical protein
MALDPETFKGRLITRTGVTWTTIIVSLVAIVRALLEVANDSEGKSARSSPGHRPINGRFEGLGNSGPDAATAR